MEVKATLSLLSGQHSSTYASPYFRSHAIKVEETVLATPALTLIYLTLFSCLRGDLDQSAHRVTCIDSRHVTVTFTLMETIFLLFASTR